MSHGIAVVGIACCYPDANSPEELWENVLAKRRAFRRLPEERLSSAGYYNADPAAVDAIYSFQAAVIEGYEFDRNRFKVAGSTFRAADPAHWLALDVADMALRDAGFPDGTGLPGKTTGVLIGNTLTGEFSRASLLRLRWPYVKRVIAARLVEEGWDAARRQTFLDSLEDSYKAPFPAADEETLAGGLSNTIAGRICNYFHLGGGGYTIDGACSSSLLALAHGCIALVGRDLDVALVGGVDLSLDPFELVGFSKAGALARGEMRVYDRDSSGFWPGEGCGMAVLMRHDDARARGLRCYAVIRGWGVSSDGGGGITRPEIDGQLLAIERAYRRAGFNPDTVELFEGHGTGTTLGDEVELRALAAARRAAPRPAAISSIKANIGHTKAAAGVAGLIKAAMALHTQIIPPNTGLVNPRPEFSEGAFRALQRAEPWPADQPLRAGVSAFGFGGINVHLALEGTSSARRVAIAGREQIPASSSQDTELFLIAAANRPGLRRRLWQLAGIAARLSYAELIDLSAALTDLSGPHRAALVASSPAQLEAGLKMLVAWLEAEEMRRLDVDAGLFIGTADRQPRLALLFPGQAAPVYLDGGEMARRFKVVRDIYEHTNLPFKDAGTTTALAQPAIVAAEIGALRLLKRFGIEGEIAVGHSLGELTALHWAGVITEDTLLDLARMRGRLMNEVAGPAGAMASVAADAASVARQLAGDVVIACFNSDRQTIISGEAGAIAEVSGRCRAADMQVTPLPIPHAFHSPLMAPAVQPFADYLVQIELLAPQRRVVSTVTGRELDRGDDLRTLLVRQLTYPVKFSQAAAALANADLCLEIGPGAILSNLMRTMTAAPTIALDAGGPSLGGLLRTIAASFVLGAAVDTKALFADRLTRRFALDWQPRFFANPCELAPQLPGDAPVERTLLPNEAPTDVPQMEESIEPLELVRQLVAKRAELPLSAVADDCRLLMDLHLNSIAVGQLVAAAARAMGLAPPVSILDFADATVAEIAIALADLRAIGSRRVGNFERNIAGVDSWVRTFVIDDVACPLPSASPTKATGGTWRVFAAEGDLFAHRFSQTLKPAQGPGVLVCLAGQSDELPISMLLEAARCALDLGGYFVMVHDRGCVASLARTLFLETSGLTVCVVNTPFEPSTVDRVLAEIEVANGYHEVHYDSTGCRTEPRLRVLPLLPDSGLLPLGATDVLLVTGGGKGIAAECALALSRESRARLAILGRSDPESDRELSNNLRRLADAGVVCRYYRADIADATAVSASIACVQAELGPITALLHAAGINRPALLRDLDATRAQSTLAPKVNGLRHLLATLDHQHLRLVVTFGSIIARTGLRGEADYAVANEALATLVQQYNDSHPDCRCLNLEWSLWSGTGMGERLARVDALLAEGIMPIPIDTGIAWLRRLITNPPQAVSVVIAGRFGDVPTLRLEKLELPLLRFLERTQVFYPGIELVTDSELSSTSDPYLDDHVFSGERLFPAVLGLEAMAQAAMAVLGRADQPGFTALEFLHPIVVPRDRPVTLRVAALVRGPNEVEVTIRCGASRFQADHFRGRCLFGEAPPQHTEAGLPPHAVVALDPNRDLYGRLFFHGGRFRRVAAYRSLRATECSAEISVPDETTWFGRYLPSGLVIGDPGLRDAALHAVQACIPHVRVLPVSVERIRAGAIDAVGPWVVKAKERSHDAESHTYDLDLVAADGRLRERWEGLKLQRIEPIPLQSWPAALLVPYLERRIRELIPGAEVTIAVNDERVGSRRDRSQHAMLAALGNHSTIHRRPDGKPTVNGARHLSAAHAGEITLAVAGPGPVACDLESIVARAGTTWSDLLGFERQALVDKIATEAREEIGVSATRVWSALECMKKAGAGPGAPLSFVACERDGWVVLNAGDKTIATCVITLENQAAQTVITILAERKQTCVPMNIAM